MPIFIFVGVMFHLTSKSSHDFEDDTLIEGLTRGLPINLFLCQSAVEEARVSAKFPSKESQAVCDQSKLLSQK